MSRIAEPYHPHGSNALEVHVCVIGLSGLLDISRYGYPIDETRGGSRAGGGSYLAVKWVTGRTNSGRTTRRSLRRRLR